MPAAAGAEARSHDRPALRLPVCRRGEPCPCKSQKEDLVTSMRDIQPEAFAFEPEFSFGEFEIGISHGSALRRIRTSNAARDEFEWGADEFEVAIPRTIHRLDCAAGCPGGLTEAQCASVVSQAVTQAIKLANNAANKLEVPTKIKPSARDNDAKETARLFRAFFGHDPSTPIGGEPSGVSVVKRFRAVANELGVGGERRIVFRCLPTRNPCADNDLTCCVPRR